MSWNSYRVFLKFIAIVVGGSITALGGVVLFGAPLSTNAQMLRGDPWYDAILDLISVFGQTWTGVGLAVFGLILTTVCYRAASR